MQVKLYAQSPGGLPELWDGKHQGYVVRKYDYMTVDLFHFDDLSDISQKTNLVGFILFNLLTMYLLARNTMNLNTRLSNVACSQGYGSHITKGLTLLLALLAPVYIIATTLWIKERILQLSKSCNREHMYPCVPESDFEKEHYKQVCSLTTSWVVKLAAMTVYLLCSMYVVKTAKRPGIIFQRGRLKCIEVYLLWSVLMSIQNIIGFAGIPIVNFAILIPMYTVFFLSANILALGILVLPFAITFYLFDLIKQRTISNIKLCVHTFELVFIYLIGSGVIFVLSVLYYVFLTGGANLAGVKGILFSLVPPLLITVTLFIIKTKVIRNNDNRKTIEYVEDEPMIGF